MNTMLVVLTVLQKYLVTVIQMFLMDVLQWIGVMLIVNLR
jgi:hypothetical protein